MQGKDADASSIYPLVADASTHVGTTMKYSEQRAQQRARRGRRGLRRKMSTRGQLALLVAAGGARAYTRASSQWQQRQQRVNRPRPKPRPTPPRDPRRLREGRLTVKTWA